MGKKTGDDGNNTFPQKWAKLLSSEWMSGAESKATDELKKNIVQWEQAISATERDMDGDPVLNGIKDKMTELKEELKEKSAVYKDTVAISVAQIKFAVHLLDTRGVQVK